MPREIKATKEELLKILEERQVLISSLVNQAKIITNMLSTLAEKDILKGNDLIPVIQNMYEHTNSSIVKANDLTTELEDLITEVKSGD